ncbi:MAG TPA: hypothetical protein VF155_08755 [Candidatus Dormibacteraeota bacterium]
MSEPAPRASEPDGRSWSAIDKFVLADGTKLRVRIESAGASVLLTFLDTRDQPLPGSPVELTRDLAESVDALTVEGHCAPALGVRISEEEEHDGLLRVFVVHGSQTSRYVQYARSEVSLDMRSAGLGVLTDGSDWRLDSGSPYRGTFTSDDKVVTGMLDGPGTRPGFDPFSEVMRLAESGDGGPLPSLPSDAVFTLAHEFETLPQGNGVLLGSIVWGYTLTWTLSAEHRSGPILRAVTPMWRPPAKEDGLNRESSLGKWWPLRSSAG